MATVRAVNARKGYRKKQPTKILTSRKHIPAGIEYVGLAGISKESQDGVLRLLQYGDTITHVRILTSAKDHCLLLTINNGDRVGVKSGFSSGYMGEGPRTFSYVLQTLQFHGAEIEEFEVSPEVIERLDNSALTQADLDAISTASPIRPRRWYDYVLDRDIRVDPSAIAWREFPLVIPFAIVDDRIADLAKSFWENPDSRLMVGYRRLEGIVRDRTAIEEHGAKLFSQAFKPDGGKLTWKGTPEGERTGRMNLFAGAYMAYRNPRAHKESRDNGERLLMEFLLLNHLYKLERQTSRVRKRGVPKRAAHP